MPLAEASMNFDVANVQPFLERLVANVPAFRNFDVNRIVPIIATMTVDTEKRWRIDVGDAERLVPVEIHAVVDDIDAVDLYFFAEPALVAAIQTEMLGFMEERGL